MANLVISVVRLANFCFGRSSGGITYFDMLQANAVVAPAAQQEGGGNFVGAPKKERSFAC